VEEEWTESGRRVDNEWRIIESGTKEKRLMIVA
jgi:hypothetical protein